MKRQTIYIALDDSGHISNSETICTYGGIIFLNKLDLYKFINGYKRIVNNIKCQYCTHKCNNKCPELKHYNLKSKDRKIFINYLKKYYLFACIIDNRKIYKNITENKKSKGRFLDYALKMMIKSAIVNLIKEKKINPNDDLEIIINIDNQEYKSNGYYNLEESIYKELKNGMINFKNNYNFKPIIKGNLTINLDFKNSKKCYTVQAADFIAGSTRKINIDFYNNENQLKERLNYINTKIFLP